jgi:predicted dehydrogenase
MSDCRNIGRRTFLKSAAAVAAFPMIVPSSALGDDKKPAASERIVMGFVGLGGQGSGDMGGFMGHKQVQIVAVCDVDRNHRNNAKKAVEGRYGPGCADYVDYRDVVTRPDIDAIFCATPDHWHALVTIEAMRNGKDVYCEKPESLTIQQGQMMVETARRYGRVFSGGSQRVWEDYNYCHRMVRGGAIGKVTDVYVNVGGPPDDMIRPAMPVPDGFEWDMWLGPAPYRPYNKDYHPFNWRGCRDFSGGQTTDWGAHGFGGASYACEVHETGPVEIYPADGKEYKQVTLVFANGIRFHHGGGWDGVISIRGTEGEISERGPRDKNKKMDIPNIQVPNYKGPGIFGDFLHCVKTREHPFRDIAIAHRTVSICHMINICYYLNRPLKWDPVKEVFVGDAEANRWLSRPMRGPWQL